MVIFQTPGGSPGYNQFESLDDAVKFVEQLRNDRDVTNARMFALEEIKFDLKPVFKVELQALNPAPAEPSVAEAPAPQEPARVPRPDPTPAPQPVSAPSEPEAAPAPAPTFGTPADTPVAPEAQEPVSEPVPAPSAPPAPAAPTPPAEEQPARRGLFGR